MADNAYTNDVVVHFTLGGNAVNGVDYFLTDQSGNPLTNNSITIPAQQAYAQIFLNPLTNVLCVSNLTVTLMLEDDPNYLVDYDNYDYLGWSSAANTIIPNVFSLVARMPAPCGIDYSPFTNSLIVSSQSGSTWSFKRIDTNGIVTDWSGVQITTGNEIVLATVKTTADGFTNGTVFFDSSGSAGAIGWLSPDGSVSNMDYFATNSGSQFLGLYVDQSGRFGGNLIGAQSGGGAWQINASNVPVAHYPGASGPVAITLLNDTNQYGPLASKIFTGESTVDTNGTVNPQMFEFSEEDCRVIPANQNLYCADDGDGWVLEVPKEIFANHVGDLLIPQNGVEDPAGLSIVHWDATQGNFVITQVPMPGDTFFTHMGNIGYFESVTFAPMDIPPVSQ